jgi:ABC-2 type transport system permease protein
MMKPTFEIAKTELKKLFYSPVSWLVLIIFSIQVTMLFDNSMSSILQAQGYGGAVYNLTHQFFASSFSAPFFRGLLGYLYLYIPMLTMNILSRDLQTGTIKLLYSAPVTNRQIILGKYLSLLIFSAILLSVVVMESIYAGLYIENADWPVIINGLLGLYLQVCAYAAVGLLMSSLTTYPVVAVVSTYVVLGFFEQIGNIGQEIPIVRDITYWFSLSNRSQQFIIGMVSTESILYFIAFIAFFLSLAVIRLHSGRRRQPVLLVAGRYVLLLVIICSVGYISSLPSLKKYWDLTRTQQNTLAKAGQDVLKKMDGGLTIRTYSNMLVPGSSNFSLPSRYKSEVERYALYTRFKPETKFEYTYYYKSVPNEIIDNYFPGFSELQLLDTLRKKNRWKFDILPYDKIPHPQDLAREGYDYTIVLKRDNGKKAYLRLFDPGPKAPEERNIIAALKSLVQPMPVIGYVTGHGERGLTDINDKGYFNNTLKKVFEMSLINNGFEFAAIDLTRPVPDSISIMVVADLKTLYSDIEMQHFRDFVSRGGNIFIAAEPGKQETMNPLLNLFSVNLEEGMLTQPKNILSPEILLCKPTQACKSLSYYFQQLNDVKGMALRMKTAAPLTWNPQQGFEVAELFRTDSNSAWNEMETKWDSDDSAQYNPEAGEVKKPHATMLALTRNINNKQQRIIISSDADWLSNAEINQPVPKTLQLNWTVFHSIFYYLSYGEAPIDVRRISPTDNKMLLEKKTWRTTSAILKWMLPLALLLASTLILIRRKGR